jgi:uncharacterized membrane protein YidH (DUF202 family)
MINLIYILAFLQLLTAVALLVIGVALAMLRYKIKQLEQDEQISHAIKKYELEWGE